MNKQKDTMTQERWAYLKTLKPDPGKYFFVSKTFKNFNPGPVELAMWGTDKTATYKKPLPKAI